MEKETTGLGAIRGDLNFGPLRKRLAFGILEKRQEGRASRRYGQASRISRVRLIFKVVGWNIGLLMALTVVMELAFGGWLEAVDKPELWRLSIYRDVAWTFNVNDRYRHAKEVHYRRDGFGLRGNYGRPEDVDVLVVGGSTTDERFVSEGDTWIDVFADCLTRRGQKLSIANGGVAGQSSRGHVRNFDYWYPFVPGLKPRWVLVYLGINENALNGRESEDDVRRYNESGRPHWVEWVKLKSALYALYTVVRGNVAAWQAGLHTARAAGDGEPASAAVDRRWRAAADVTIERASPVYDERLAREIAARKPELESYTQRLRALINAIDTFGAKTILATQSRSDYRLEGEWVRGNLDSYFDLAAVNATTLAVCRESGAVCIDVASDFRASDGDFYDAVHTTAQGSRKVGEAMCRAFGDQPLARAL